MYPRSVNKPIMSKLLYSPLSTKELAAALDIPPNDRQKLYTRLYELRRSGYIELMYSRSCANQKEVEAEQNLKKGRPPGRPEWWKWRLTFQGEAVAKQFRT